MQWREKRAVTSESEKNMVEIQTRKKKRTARYYQSYVLANICLE